MAHWARSSADIGRKRDVVEEQHAGLAAVRERARRLDFARSRKTAASSSRAELRDAATAGVPRVPLEAQPARGADEPRIVLEEIELRSFDVHF